MSNDQRRNLKMEEHLKRRSMQRQGLPASNNNAYDLQQTLEKSLPASLRPGNVGALNRVLWPFWFTFSAPELAPQTSSQSFVTITQEAAFVWMSMTKAVYRKTTGPTQYTYIDPNDETALGQADALKMTLRDAQSSRVFSNAPLEVDHIGHPDYPTILPTPIMFLPNSTIETTYQNDNATDTFVPRITLFGYRVRIEDAQNLLGLVVG